MEFCSNCGSYMKKVKDGFLCPRCGSLVRSGSEVQPMPTGKTSDFSSIDVADPSRELLEKISQVCPKCGNIEAFHWFSGVSGEHAGIRRERMIEHFKCIRCSHTWAKSS